MKNLKIIFDPIEKNITEIEKWGGEKSYLYKSFKEKTLIVAEVDNKTIGFYCLSKLKNGITITIETAEIKHEYRNKHIASLMFERILKKYKNKKSLCFTLHCSPKESRFFWEKLGFEYFPENTNSHQIKMYKEIKNLNTQVECLGDYPNTIEVLDDFSKSYKWKFDLEEESSLLKLPIVFFGYYKWKIILRMNGKVLFSDEFRRFDKSNEINNCIFIKSIPERFFNI